MSCYLFTLIVGSGKTHPDCCSGSLLGMSCYFFTLTVGSGKTHPDCWNGSLLGLSCYLCMIIVGSVKLIQVVVLAHYWDDL